MDDDDFDDEEITEEQIEDVMQGLISKGFAISFVKDGQTFYKITDEGKAAYRMKDVDPKKLN